MSTVVMGPMGRGRRGGRGGGRWPWEIIGEAACWEIGAWLYLVGPSWGGGSIGCVGVVVHGGRRFKDWSEKVLGTKGF